MKRVAIAVVVALGIVMVVLLTAFMPRAIQQSILGGEQPDVFVAFPETGFIGSGPEFSCKGSTSTDGDFIPASTCTFNYVAPDYVWKSGHVQLAIKPIYDLAKMPDYQKDRSINAVVVYNNKEYMVKSGTRTKLDDYVDVRVDMPADIETVAKYCGHQSFSKKDQATTYCGSFERLVKIRYEVSTWIDVDRFLSIQYTGSQDLQWTKPFNAIFHIENNFGTPLDVGVLSWKSSNILFRGEFTYKESNGASGNVNVDVPTSEIGLYTIEAYPSMRIQTARRAQSNEVWLRTVNGLNAQFDVEPQVISGPQGESQAGSPVSVTRAIRKTDVTTPPVLIKNSQVSSTRETIDSQTSATVTDEPSSFRATGAIIGFLILGVILLGLLTSFVKEK